MSKEKGREVRVKQEDDNTTASGDAKECKRRRCDSTHGPIVEIVRTSELALATRNTHDAPLTVSRLPTVPEHGTYEFSEFYPSLSESMTLSVVFQYYSRTRMSDERFRRLAFANAKLLMYFNASSSRSTSHFEGRFELKSRLSPDQVRFVDRQISYKLMNKARKVYDILYETPGFGSMLTVLIYPTGYSWVSHRAFNAVKIA